MSEGPEVRRLAQRLDRLLRGAELLRIETRLRKAQVWLESHPGAFDGAHFEAIESCGKHLVFRLEGQRWIHCHLLMFGRFEVLGAEAQPADDPNERARLVTSRALLRFIRGQVLDLGLGDPYRELPSLAQLGPDVLAEPFDEAEFRARLLVPEHRDQEVAVALLDQTLANGVGNYLKSEILFRASLNPWRTIGSLQPHEISDLIESMVEVCQRAFRARGRTVPPRISPRLLAATGSWARSPRHWVFRRTKQPCYRCETPIRQARQGPAPGRWTFFCPRCQQVEAPASLQPASVSLTA